MTEPREPEPIPEPEPEPPEDDPAITDEPPTEDNA